MSSIEAIPPTAGATTAPAGTLPAGVENPGALLGRDAFLRLLVAQLKYQDPTKPADASQMLAQSAQLTMVERLNDLAASFEASTATQRLSLAGTMVGRDVSFIGPDGGELSATVTSARVDPDGLILVAGSYEVPYDAITAVLAPTSAPAAPAPAAPVPVDPAPAPADEPTTAPLETSPDAGTEATTDATTDATSAVSGGVTAAADVPTSSSVT